MNDTYLQALLITDSTLRLAVPLILAAMAGIFAERSGVIDIGLEGKMLGGAFAAAATAAVIPNVYLALGVAVLFGVMLSMIHGFASITCRGNQVVSGMALNILVAGLGPTLADSWFGEAGRTPLLGNDARFLPIELPLTETLGTLPYFGPFYAEVVSGHNLLVYLTVLVVIAVTYVIYRTRFGLRLRAVGETPEAVDTAGISVIAMRYRALIVTGVLSGTAGAYLSIAHSAGFIRDMTAGKGYLALAAMIFGKWRPLPTLFACLLFAFTDAIQVRLQGQAIPGIGEIPVQFIQALPYVLTVLLLAGFVGKAVAPKAIGQPYVKER